MKFLPILITLLFFNYSYSCSCAIRGELSVSDYYQPDVILLGKVIKLEENSLTPELEYNTKEITIEIKEFFKGRLQDVRQIKIYTSFSDASCGLAVNNTGEDWIIFAHYNKHGYLLTDMCTPSKTIKEPGDEYLVKLKSYRDAVGVTKFYNSKQILSAEGELINGQPHGLWSYYGGTWLSQTGFYDNGLKDSTWTLYNAKGKIDRIENFKNGNRHGTAIQYNWHNGYPAKIRYYEDGKRTGRTFVFYDDGQLMIEGQFEQNKPVGEWVAYNTDGEVVCKTLDREISRRQDTGIFSCE